jgi:2-polyprenyl-3-methyl-5-hydroxy-6-metoxy-1,4-benzoquinol methylase
MIKHAAGESRTNNETSRGYSSDMRLKKLVKSKPIDRQAFILSYCSGKKVLDIGCADYPMTTEKAGNGELLYANLCRVAAKVTGVDYSHEGVQVLSSLGYENLIVGDAENLQSLNLDDSFDVIVAGELIEHLMNVGRFFEGVRSIMTAQTSLILSVPNAHAAKRFLRVLFGSELVNRDHAYYFSQANIELLCERYGLETCECHYSLADASGSLKKYLFMPLKMAIAYLSPYVSDHLVFVCRVAP